jgi:hypothetical protein
MQQAPAVRYPLGPSRFLARTMTALLLCGATAMLYWAWRQSVGQDARAWSLLSVPLSAAAAHHWWASQAVGHLVWDTGQWQLQVAELSEAGTLHVQVDLPRHLWLEWRSLSSGKKNWLWLEQKSDPGQWLALRRAVFAKVHTAAATALTSGSTAS